MTNFRGLLTLLFSNNLASDHINFFSLLLSIAVIVCAGIFVRPKSNLHALAIAILLTLGGGYYTFTHDLSLLLIPLIVLLRSLDTVRLLEAAALFAWPAVLAIHAQWFPYYSLLILFVAINLCLPDREDKHTPLPRQSPDLVNA
jgi:hypothetical protein